MEPLRADIHTTVDDGPVTCTVEGDQIQVKMGKGGQMSAIGLTCLLSFDVAELLAGDLLENLWRVRASGGDVE